MAVTRDAITDRLAGVREETSLTVLIVEAREDVVMADQAAALLGRGDG